MGRDLFAEADAREYLDELRREQQERDELLDKALAALEAEANNFGSRMVQDTKVRREYAEAVKEFSKEVRAAVAAGEVTAEEGARLASEMRNELMELARLKSSDIGRAAAEELKATGKSLQQLVEHYADKRYGKAYAALTEAERGHVHLEVIEASGRANPKVTLRAKRLGAVGKGLWVFSVGIAVHNVATADNKVLATLREGAIFGGGWLGGAIGGAAAGLICGPGAPVCSGVGVFVGGALGALGTDVGLDWASEMIHRKVKQLNGIRPAYGFPGKMPPIFCFPAGTPVWCPGRARPINALRPGDAVFAYDPGAARVVAARATALDVHTADVDLLRVRIACDEAARRDGPSCTVEVTPGHWFLTGEDRWATSEHLHEAGRVITADGRARRVAVEAAGSHRDLTVYNVRTDRGTYLVGTAGAVVSGVVVEEPEAERWVEALDARGDALRV